MNKNNNTLKFPPFRSEGRLGRGSGIRNWLTSILLLLLAFITSVGAEPITFQYIYDDAGQLIKVIDSTGTMVEYFYDETGNRTGVRNSTVSGVAIFNFTPKQGPVGKTVTIQGQGFKSTPADNIVKFNGVTATVLRADAHNLKVTVPEGAETGPISVAVLEGTGTSSTDFTVINSPVITGINPAIATSQKGAIVPLSNLTVSGVNLTASTFHFQPLLEPLAITIDTATIAADGKSATLDLSIAAGTVGGFTLLATNTIGSSEPLPTVANSLIIVDENTDSDLDLLTDFEESSLCTDPLNPDTDSDGFSDKEEIDNASDPCGAGSIPADALALVREASGPTISILNRQAPPIVFIGETTGPTISILNQENPPIDTFIGETTGPTISIQTGP